MTYVNILIPILEEKIEHIEKGIKVSKEHIEEHPEANHTAVKIALATMEDVRDKLRFRIMMEGKPEDLKTYYKEE